ncbi:glycoside hydrolase family 88 protein [Sphingobacterium arenae]|uniref:Glycoside hydrolase family 88 protein n=1 Tax=Sphingobacterium arenae TaxID=1280598 RepID=A0ABR7XYQ0_9SPHI|nr:glycoside hydrolase family 88 protein [Sphingobacterium arenae]MBD1424190.1 glycoside hydrolase family 88 protein [Sphingobacterium arenae]
MKIITSTLLLCSLAFSSCHTDDSSKSLLEKSEKQLSMLRTAALNEHKNPRTLTKDGHIHWIQSSYDWTEGFWPGTCWMLYEHTNDKKWKEAAEASQQLFEPHKDLTTDHDLGFIFNNSYGKAYRITKEERYKQVLLDAARALSTRFNDTVGCIQSWDVDHGWQAERGWKFPVIIDNMMNLEMLFEASDITTDSSYRKIAVAHANTTMANHFRPDGSSFHVVDYDPETGKVAHQVTAQGYSDESAWARGQAWALYGYTMCYRYTKDKKYLNFAEKIAAFILNHPNYPEDGVPYWDFDAPNIPNEIRDASSGAILASALLELSSYTDDKYLASAQHILDSLASDTYTAKTGENGNFILKHSVGSIPHGNEIDVPLNYADYYYIEALSRLKERGL